VAGPPGAPAREADGRRAAPAAEAAPAPEATPAALAARSGAGRTRSMRQAIARLMARSKREIPHYYVRNTVAMTSSLDWMLAAVQRDARWGGCVVAGERGFRGGSGCGGWRATTP